MGFSLYPKWKIDFLWTITQLFWVSRLLDTSNETVLNKGLISSIYIFMGQVLAPNSSFSFLNIHVYNNHKTPNWQHFRQ